MSEGHQWCRDVSRDEAVRAAEDAAAVPAIQHRDLPEVVAALTERVAKIEEAMMSGSTWYPICDIPAPPPPPAPPQPAPVPPANGLRTERVTPPWQRAKWDEALAIICDGGDWGRGNNFDHGVLGALVIWADKEMDRLTAERDLARAVRDGLRSQRDAARARVSELEAAPPPRGWLTAEERETVEKCLRHFVRQEIDFLERNDPGNRWLEVWRREEAILRALLARSTPPKVKVPSELMLCEARGVRIVYDAGKVKRAIRAAGGEVEG